MERHSMRAIREVLRLRHELGLRFREISAATGLSLGSVSEYLSRAAREGVSAKEEQPSSMRRRNERVQELGR